MTSGAQGNAPTSGTSGSMPTPGTSSNAPTLTAPNTTPNNRRFLTDSRATLIGAIITAAAALVATFFGGRLSSSGSSVTATAQAPSLGPINLPGNDGTIGAVVDLSGTVHNLKPGQVVWTFNQPISGDPATGTYFAETGPCAISGDTWSCNNVYIGDAVSSADPEAGKGNYLIWAVILSDQDAFNVVDELRCHSTNGHPCPTISKLPGTDIAQPQKVMVIRPN
jgi:hypothetical protein